MKVYVASSFSNKPAVRSAIALIRDAGHEITHDWTPADPGDRTGDELAQYCAENAIEDIELGVRPADVVVVLHDERGRGMLIECGGAIYDGAKRIIVVNPPADPMKQVFYLHPTVSRVGAVDDAVALLNAWQKVQDALAVGPLKGVPLALTGEDVAPSIEHLLKMLRAHEMALVHAGVVPSVAVVRIAVALGAVLENTLNGITPTEMRETIRDYGVRLSKFIANKGSAPVASA